MLQLITILNRCHRFRGFVYHQARFSSDHKSIEIAVRPRKVWFSEIGSLPEPMMFRVTRGRLRLCASDEMSRNRIRGFSDPILIFNDREHGWGDW